MGKANYDVPAVRTAIRLLEVLGTSRHPLGVSDIARAIDSNKNMTYRLLSTLQDEGWITAEEPGPRYRMTLVPFQVTSQPLATLDLRTAAAGPMLELWEELGESLYLGILDNDSVLYLEHLDSRQNLRIAGRVGGRYPLHCTGPGKMLLAHAGEKHIKRIAKSGLEAFTEGTITTAAALETELATIRKRGWSVDREEYGRGLLCFAAPIRDYSGTVIGTLGTSVTTLSHTVEDLVNEIGPKVLTTARAISTNMGWSKC